ncbi:DUF167 domain-containing protein [Chloroflexota bacterium]
MFEQGIRITVRVRPSAPRNMVESFDEDVLCLRIASPPVDGKANAELVSFLAKLLGLPKSGVSILKGQKGRQKIISFTGLDSETIRQRLISACGGKSSK